jgi:cysteinyl-tRNA synthetase
VFRLYDTRTRQVKAVEPARRGLLSMYSCGPAVHRRQHIGDLRSYLVADLIRRNAEHRHHLAVLACQGISDVGSDDCTVSDPGVTGSPGEGNVMSRAAAGGAFMPELARSHGDAFRADCLALNVRPAEHSPRASASVGLAVDMIARLIEAGSAYLTASGSVYFDTRSFASFGELSAVADAGETVGRRAAGGAEERAGTDWALWQGAPDDHELTWRAPWGSGYPVQPAECTAMSLHHLGHVIDIRTGCIDQLFPCDERERAQANSVTGHEVVRHWVHAGQLLFEGLMMAGSTPHGVLMADLADRGLDPLALRLAFLEHRYRHQVNLTWDTLSVADRTLCQWRRRVAEWACSPSKPAHRPVAAQIAAAFDDDLDTPAALRALHMLETDQDIAPGSKFESFARADQLLGLDVSRDIGRNNSPA